MLFNPKYDQNFIFQQVQKYFTETKKQLPPGVAFIESTVYQVGLRHWRQTRRNIFLTGAAAAERQTREANRRRLMSRMMNNGYIAEDRLGGRRRASESID